MISVNDTTDRDIAPESMNFWKAFPRILQEIWEEYPTEDPTQVSKLDITGMYHRGNFQPPRVGVFMYVVPLAPEENCIIIFIDLIL